ncbi:MAG: hypothetical protein ACLP19_16080 [Xanthobacteraceae bacterium]
MRGNAREVARFLGITSNRVGELAAEGWFSRGPDGLISYHEAVLGWRRALAKEPNAHGKAVARLTEAKVKLAEQRAAREAGRLAPAQELFDVGVHFFSYTVGALEALPARYTRDLNERKRLKKLLDTMRQEWVQHWQQETAQYEGDKANGHNRNLQ